MIRQILLIAFLFCAFGLFAQDTDSQLTTQVQNTIRGKTYSPENAANMFQEIINGKISRIPAPTTGTNNYSVSIQGLDTYANRLIFVQFGNTNTTAVTLLANVMAPQPVQKRVGGSWVDLASGDIVAGKTYALVHDGTRFQIDIAETNAFLNGLTKTGSTVTWEGLLTKETIIDGDGNNLYFDNLGSFAVTTTGNFDINVPSGFIGSFQGLGTYEFTRPVGYGTAGMVTGLQSFSDKEYSDTHLGGKTFVAPTITQNNQSIRWNNTGNTWEYFTPTSYTFSNGMFNSGGTVKLGSNLSENTVIDNGAFSFHLGASGSTGTSMVRSGTAYAAASYLSPTNSQAALHGDTNNRFYISSVNDDPAFLAKVHSSGTTQFNILSLNRASGSASIGVGGGLGVLFNPNAGSGSLQYVVTNATGGSYEGKFRVNATIANTSTLISEIGKTTFFNNIDGVAIGNTTLGTSGLLELTSTTKALLLSRIATEGNITTPVNGMLYYNSTLNKVRAYQNGSWGDLGGGAGVTDGDKGDITVSGSGATWTVDNTAVTFAKIQNINTSRLLGRSTASTGSVEELTIGAGLALSGGVLAAEINSGNLALNIDATPYGLLSNNTSVAGSTITLDMNGQKQRSFNGSATFATAKTVAVTNSSNTYTFVWTFEITNLAAALTVPADWYLNSPDYNTSVWTPPATGKYFLSGKWDSVLSAWFININGPYTH